MRARRHVGLTPWRKGASHGVELLAQARRAELLGFDSFWLPESHFLRDARPSPLIELAAIAGCTERVRLGTSSLLLPIRNPVAAAEDVAVLDQLSGGRLILGLGRGFRPDLFRVFEVDPATKRSVFEQHLTRMRSAWAGEPLLPFERDEAGSEDRSSTRRPVRLEPRPVQRPHPPLWLAAFGPKALAQAGRLGLPYLASPLETFSEIRRNWTVVRAAARETQRATDEVGAASHVPLMRTVFVSERSDRLAAARHQLEVEQQQWRAARRGALAPRPEATGAEPDESDDERALVGSPARVLDRLRHWEGELGVTHWILRPGPQHAAAEWLEESVNLLSELLVADQDS